MSGHLGKNEQTPPNNLYFIVFFFNITQGNVPRFPNLSFTHIIISYHQPQLWELTSTSFWLLFKLFCSRAYCLVMAHILRSQRTQNGMFVFRVCACFSSYLLSGALLVLIDFSLLISRQCSGSILASIILGWQHRIAFHSNVNGTEWGPHVNLLAISPPSVYWTVYT